MAPCRLLNPTLFHSDLVNIKAQSLFICPFGIALVLLKLCGVSRRCGVTRSLNRLSALAAGQVRRQQGEEAAAQQQAGPDVLRQPAAGEAAGQRLAAFLRAAPAAAARLEHGAHRPLPVQPADLHDRRQPPVRGVRAGVGQLKALLLWAGLTGPERPGWRRCGGQ